MRHLSPAMVGRSLLVYGLVRAIVLPMQLWGGISIVGGGDGGAVLLGVLLILVAFAGAALPLAAGWAAREGRAQPSPFGLLITLAVLDGLVFAVGWITAPLRLMPFTGAFVALVVIDLLAASTVRSAERNPG